jgi:hypothetical protein
MPVEEALDKPPIAPLALHEHRGSPAPPQRKKAAPHRHRPGPRRLHRQTQGRTPQPLPDPGAPPAPRAHQPGPHGRRDPGPPGRRRRDAVTGHSAARKPPQPRHTATTGEPDRAARPAPEPRPAGGRRRAAFRWPNCAGWPVACSCCQAWQQARFLDRLWRHGPFTARPGCIARRTLRGTSSLENKPALTTLNGESGPRRRVRPRTKQEREREAGAAWKPQRPSSLAAGPGASGGAARSEGAT